MLRRRRAAQINRQSVPYGSTKIEYLESSGKEFIFTPKLLDWKDKIVECDHYAINLKEDYPSYAGAWIGVFGGQKIDGGGKWMPSYFLWHKNNKKSGFIRGGNTNYYFEPLDDARRTITIGINDVKINGEIVHNFVPSTTQPITPTNYRGCIFGLLNGQWETPGYIHITPQLKIFSCKIFDTNNTGFWNITPSIDKTGTPCMFDLVTRKNFYNSGTGQFIYPTTSATYSLRRPQAEWAKMTDTGVHKIYHTPIDYEGSLEDYAIENGYKRLIETESPNEEGKYYSLKWVETDDTLATEWFEVDPSQEEFFEENLDNPIE